MQMAQFMMTADVNMDEDIYLPRGGQTFIPCINVTATETYVRTAAVQAALNVAPQSQK